MYFSRIILPFLGCQISNIFLEKNNRHTTNFDNQAIEVDLKGQQNFLKESILIAFEFIWKYCSPFHFLFYFPDKILPEHLSTFMDNNCTFKCESTAYGFFTFSRKLMSFETGAFEIKNKYSMIYFIFIFNCVKRPWGCWCEVLHPQRQNFLVQVRSLIADRLHNDQLIIARTKKSCQFHSTDMMFFQTDCWIYYYELRSKKHDKVLYHRYITVNDTSVSHIIFSQCIGPYWVVMMV